MPADPNFIPTLKTKNIAVTSEVRKTDLSMKRNTSYIRDVWGGAFSIGNRLFDFFAGAQRHRGLTVKWWVGGFARRTCVVCGLWRACTLLYPAMPWHTMLAPCHTFPYPGITLYLAILCHTFPYLAYHACTLLYPAITLHRPSHCFAWEDRTSKMREQHQLEKATYEIQMILPSGRIP